MNIEQYVSLYQEKINAGMSLKDAVDEFKKKLILDAHWTSVSRSEAARKLGMKRPGMIAVCQQYDITDECDDILAHNMREQRGESRASNHVIYMSRLRG